MRPREGGAAQDVRGDACAFGVAKNGHEQPLHEFPSPTSQPLAARGARSGRFAVTEPRSGRVESLLDFQEPRQRIRQDECACEFRFAFSTFRADGVGYPDHFADSTSRTICSGSTSAETQMPMKTRAPAACQ